MWSRDYRIHISHYWAEYHVTLHHITLLGRISRYITSHHETANKRKRQRGEGEEFCVESYIVSLTISGYVLEWVSRSDSFHLHWPHHRPSCRPNPKHARWPSKLTSSFQCLPSSTHVFLLVCKLALFHSFVGLLAKRTVLSSSVF